MCLVETLTLVQADGRRYEQRYIRHCQDSVGGQLCGQTEYLDLGHRQVQEVRPRSPRGHQHEPLESPSHVSASHIEPGVTRKPSQSKRVRVADKFANMVLGKRFITEKKEKRKSRESEQEIFITQPHPPRTPRPTADPYMVPAPEPPSADDGYRGYTRPGPLQSHPQDTEPLYVQRIPRFRRDSNVNVVHQDEAALRTPPNTGGHRTSPGYQPFETVYNAPISPISPDAYRDDPSDFAGPSGSQHNDDEYQARQLHRETERKRRSDEYRAQLDAARQAEIEELRHELEDKDEQLAEARRHLEQIQTQQYPRSGRESFSRRVEMDKARRVAEEQQREQNNRIYHLRREAAEAQQRFNEAVRRQAEATPPPRRVAGLSRLDRENLLQESRADEARARARTQDLAAQLGLDGLTLDDEGEQQPQPQPQQQQQQQQAGLERRNTTTGARRRSKKSRGGHQRYYHG